VSDLILFVCFLINYFFRDLIEGCPLTVGRLPCILWDRRRRGEWGYPFRRSKYQPIRY